MRLAWVLETDSILIKGKRERFLKRQTGCLKRFDGIKLNRRKYISISEVILLSYTPFYCNAECHCAVLMSVMAPTLASKIKTKTMSLKSFLIF